MPEKPEQSKLISQEIDQRAENEKILAELDGFNNLSEDQQRFLRATLYIQQRAERGTDPGSADQINPVPPRFEQYSLGPYITSADTDPYNPEPNKYKKSQKYIMEEYCHQSVVELATRGDAKFKLENDEWRDGGEVKNFADLEALLSAMADRRSTPWILQALYFEENEYFINRRMHHSLVVLGKNKEGNYIVWEKSGLGLPFTLKNLRQVYDAYPYSNVWRVRPLPISQKQ